MYVHKKNQEDRKKYLAAKQHKANLKSQIEKVHESKKPDDSGIKIQGKEINKTANNEMINPGKTLKSHIENVHESRKKPSQIDEFIVPKLQGSEKVVETTEMIQEEIENSKMQ